MLNQKMEIEQALNTLSLDNAKALIDTYASIHPFDMDLLSYRCIYHIYANELEDALAYAIQGVQQYPTNADMYYNLAYIYELLDEYLLACENYTKALFLYTYTNDEKSKSLCISEKVATLWDSVETLLAQTNDPDFHQSVQTYLERFHTCFGFNEIIFKSHVDSIGQTHWMSNTEKRYLALYRVQYKDNLDISNNLIHTKSELLQTTDCDFYQINGNAEQYLLPIAVDKENTVHVFKEEGIPYQILQRETMHFNYYKVKNHTCIYSTNISHHGTPIPLGHSANRKKLVLNLFVDGLSQDILNTNGLESIMPYTYNFFKKGTICTQAYSTAEWTYPSLATYVTGLTTPEHMMFHNKIDIALPTNVPTLAEYFHNAGYFTAKMDGDWRSTPNYGHGRGYDQIIYQNQVLGSKEETIIGEIIDHIEAFQDTDQFLWVCLGDLHDVADEYDLTLAVQNKLNLSERVMEPAAETSVKQHYSSLKINAYKELIRHTDILLNTLYTYITEKFNEEEILISLFADHGQGYLIPNDQPFLAKQRTNVAFMFRGNVPTQITSELISTSDYITIMCNAAGIPMEQNSITGSLPACFGGTSTREYVLSESIHPKDPYRATIFTQDNTFFFENGVPTGEDGRFELKDYTMVLMNKENQIYNNDKLCNKYLDIITEHIAKLIIY